MGAQLQRLIAALIGVVAWHGEFWTIAVSLVFPALVFHQPTRARAAAIAAAYYGAASWPLTSILSQKWTWAAATLLLSLPWIALWSPQGSAWRIPAALVLTALPPIGLIGWASPLTAAGILFPGTGWLGLVATAFLPTHRTAAAALSLLAITVQKSPPVPNRWIAFDTNGEDFESVQRTALNSTARVILFPESTVPRWNEATDLFWQPTIDALRTRGQTLLLGTTRALPGSAEYQNILLGLGANPITFVQRNPPPYAMWKPFGPKDGTHLRLTGPGTQQIAGHRAAILICYEQLLVWPILHSVLEHPTIILGIANNRWCRNTRVPGVQQACTKAWARLFGLPMLTAANH